MNPVVMVKEKILISCLQLGTQDMEGQIPPYLEAGGGLHWTESSRCIKGVQGVVLSCGDLDRSTLMVYFRGLIPIMAYSL